MPAWNVNDANTWSCARCMSHCSCIQGQFGACTYSSRSHIRMVNQCTYPYLYVHLYHISIFTYAKTKNTNVYCYIFAYIHHSGL